MRERVKNWRTILLASVIVSFLMLPVKTFAASYPILIAKNFNIHANTGDVVSIEYLYWPEYKNERIDIEVLNSNGEVVATSSRSFYHTYSGTQDYTVTWDTAGESPGDYRVVAHKCFYSLYSWHEAPTTSACYVTLACSHSWDSGTVTKKPDCIHEGVRTYKCTVCGATETKAIPASGIHTWDEGKVTTAPTETREGIKTFTCIVCGKTKTKSIAKINPITISKAPSSVKAKAKKNKVTVSWKKNKKILSKVKSIQVQFSTDKGFEQNVITKKTSKKKTSIKIKLKKKTTYYVRVRYLGSKGYSKWSSVKKVKTK